MSEPERGQFRYVLTFESEVTGEEFDRLEMPLSRRYDAVGMPGPIAQTLCVASMMQFMAGKAMCAAIVYTLTQCRLAWCRPFVGIDSPGPCAHCGAPAICFGVYEDPEREPDRACDTCCAHGNEDGWCKPIGGEWPEDSKQGAHHASST